MEENTKKLNCWEYMKCGMENGGPKSKELGVCPVANTAKLHGVHDGWNGGRACWVVAGTLCGGEVQGAFAKKYENCNVCDFYNHVRDQEMGNFKLSATLLNKLK